MVSSRKPATIDDLIARGDYDRLEIIGGEIVEKAAPSGKHSRGSARFPQTLAPFDRRAGGPRGPGGWWIHVELHVQYASGELYCHDVCGFRRDRVAAEPSGWPVSITPDWVCEIVSPKHEKTDLVDKARVLHRAKVPHYWLAIPEEKVLLVQRWSADGYTIVQQGKAGERVRAEPFDAIEIEVGVLFGDDEAEI
jgi:Uma2 family endonuclease